MTEPAARPSTLVYCRTCGSDRLKLFLAMGDHPPANMFLRPDELGRDHKAWPLNAQACLDCGLIQVADQVPADYYRHYLYVPSGAATMHDHFSGLADVLMDRARGGLIVDIGCNDGLMLGFAARKGARVLGVDPAANIAPMAEERGVPVHIAYFSPQVAAELRETHGPAAVISATNTFNHIDDLTGFVEGVMTLLADDGVFVVEVPWAKAIIEKNQFDNVYHEHISELSLRSMVELGKRTGLEVVDVELLPVHAGSLRVFMRRPGHEAVSDRVTDFLAQEDAAGVRDAAAYDRFGDRARDAKQDLLALLDDLKAKGAKIAGYGAPAKGNTILNFYNIGPDKLDYLVDRNPLKHGTYSPGMQIPILPVETIAERKPDYLLVLAWNFFDEIRSQLADYEAAGGQFIVPLPSPQVIGRKPDA
ncbi:class I SAM-dependent methyltransferase [Paracoccus sp. (in: a-proteobacteria)]|uniref:class I SAM-dependent methyltransferase n=1 Tax=Paracoccus sp. TaxID=267 RepID=UPI0035B4DCD3